MKLDFYEKTTIAQKSKKVNWDDSARGRTRIPSVSL